MHGKAACNCINRVHPAINVANDIGEAEELYTVSFHKVPGAVEIYTVSATGKLVYLSYKKSDGYYYLGIYNPSTDTVINESRAPESYRRIYYLDEYMYATPTDTFSKIVSTL